MNKKLKIIISGGGTGGHIFPAVSIANELKAMMPDCEIQFVGALGRMEMERVPAAGYPIIGLPVMGFPRKPGLKTFKFFINLLKSASQAKKIVKEFKPNVAVGVGGYASGPVLRAAASKGIPALVQEQNSYAGITNKLLGKKVDKICVAYDNMERFFPKEKIVLTGNPVRKNLLDASNLKSEAIQYFQLDANTKTIVIVGGSLGARTLNESVLNSIEKIKMSGVQVIWQTGAYYYKEILKQTENIDCLNLQVHEFLSRMDLAYAAADLVISRAGAGTISELCLMKKATILVPSPNVAEDHQTKNAMALVEKNAAELVTDVDAKETLINKAIELVNEDEKLNNLKANIGLLAKPNAASDIAKIVIELASK